jgi:hypothetical protein
MIRGRTGATISGRGFGHSGAILVARNFILYLSTLTNTFLLSEHFFLSFCLLGLEKIIGRDDNVFLFLLVSCKVDYHK